MKHSREDKQAPRAHGRCPSLCPLFQQRKGLRARSRVAALAAVFLGVLLLPYTAGGTEESGPEDVPLTSLSAPQAVRLGNQRLRAGDAAAAMEAYRHAEALAPDAAEIAFVKGLAHFELHQFEEAREAFYRAAAAGDGALANDALYSLGTCDHAEALEKLNDPHLATRLLESAMRQYQDVLADDADHRAAREANFKAAAVWKQIQELLQQQQQDRQEPGPRESRADSQQQERKETPPEDGHQQDQTQSQQEPQPADEQEQPRDAPREASSRDEEAEEQPAEASTPDSERSGDPREASAGRDEQVSREQAQRRLREMMQAIRERKKVRPETADRTPVKPVDKDW